MTWKAPCRPSRQLYWLIQPLKKLKQVGWNQILHTIYRFVIDIYFFFFKYPHSVFPGCNTVQADVIHHRETAVPSPQYYITYSLRLTTRGGPLSDQRTEVKWRSALLDRHPGLNPTSTITTGRRRIWNMQGIMGGHKNYEHNTKYKTKYACRVSFVSPVQISIIIQ